jgi:hypothetical protein
MRFGGRRTAGGVAGLLFMFWIYRVRPYIVVDR